MCQCRRPSGRRYSLTSTKVGLLTWSDEPQPRARPLMKVVLPAPSSPLSVTTSPGLSSSPNRAPKRTVCSGEWLQKSSECESRIGISRHYNMPCRNSCYHGRWIPSPMRILVISDIHANLTALEAVLAHASDYEAVWYLGDLVGYGPDPNEC